MLIVGRRGIKKESINKNEIDLTMDDFNFPPSFYHIGDKIVYENKETGFTKTIKEFIYWSKL